MAVEIVQRDYNSFIGCWVGDPELPSGRRIFVGWEIPKMRDGMDVLDLEWTLNHLLNNAHR